MIDVRCLCDVRWKGQFFRILGMEGKDISRGCLKKKIELVV